MKVFFNNIMKLIQKETLQQKIFKRINTNKTSKNKNIIISNK